MPRCAFALLFLASIQLGCRSARPHSDPAEAPAVLRGPFHQDLLLTGSLRAAQQSELTVPRLPTWRTSIRWLAAEGAEVEAGDLVAELDNSTFLTEQQEARLAVSGAANELLRQQASSQIAIGEKEYAVERQLVAIAKARIDAEIPQSIVAAKTYQEAQLALRRAEIDHHKAIAELNAARVTASGLKANLALDLTKAQRRLTNAERGILALQLTADRAGLVLIAEHPWELRKLKVGDTVFVGWTVASLPDLEVMEIDAWLSDVDDGKVTVGMPASIVLDAQPDQSYAGRVARISAVASEMDKGSLRRAFRVVLDLDTTDPLRMSPGMSAAVRVHVAALGQAVLLPRRAIDRSVSPPQIQLASGEHRSVELGPCSAMHCVLLTDIPVPTALRLPAGTR